MKKTLSLLLVAVLLACAALSLGVFAEDEGRDISVTLDGEAIDFDVPPVLVDGRTMVPMRAIFEALGALVSWDDESQTASAVKVDITVKITIDKKILDKNDEEIELDVPAMLVDDRTLVPLRAVSESFEVNVSWDDATSTVSLTSKTEVKVEKPSAKLALTEENFVAGPGYNIVTKDNAITAENTPVTVKAADDGLSVMHGGYYNSGLIWGGVATKEKLTVDGLSVTIRFDEVPEVTAEDDCWISIDFLAKPELFRTSAVKDNPGFMNLIRFGRPGWEIYEGITAFSGVHTKNDEPMFAVKTGDVITISAKLVDGKYQFTFTNGDKSYSWTNENADFAKIFEDGKAHVVVSASLKGSEKDAFKYTITEIAYPEA